MTSNKGIISLSLAEKVECFKTFHSKTSMEHPSNLSSWHENEASHKSKSAVSSISRLFPVVSSLLSECTFLPDFRLWLPLSCPSRNRLFRNQNGGRRCEIWCRCCRILHDWPREVSLRNEVNMSVHYWLKLLDIMIIFLSFSAMFRGFPKQAKPYMGQNSRWASVEKELINAWWQLD